MEMYLWLYSESDATGAIYSPHCRDCDLWKVIWYFSNVGCYILCSMLNLYSQTHTKKANLQQHLETQPIICSLILTVMQIKLSLRLQRSHRRNVCWTHVTEAQSGWHWPSLLLLFTCIVCYMGMRTAESLPIVDLLYFVLSHQCWCTGACTHRHRHTDTLTLYARELHHFKGFNLRTKKMAGGGKLVGEHGCFSRRRGSTSEGPLISHNPAKLSTRTKWHHTACVAISRCKI